MATTHGMIGHSDLCAPAGASANAALQTDVATEPPAWMQRLAQAFDEYFGGAERPPVGEVDSGLVQLLAPVAPLIESARRQLRAGLAELQAQSGDAPDVAGWEPHLILNLCQRLSRLTARSVVVEMHHAAQTGKLGSGAPEQRFARFITQLQSPQGALEFLAKYPALAEQAVMTAEHWSAASLEFAGRLAHDWPQIQRQFFPGAALRQVTAIECGAGDLHRGGRSVFLLKFDHGERLVYKPRSLAIEGHFQDFLAWLNRRGASHALHRLEMMDRGDYGWVEFVAQVDVVDAAAAGRFYHRLGCHVALCYLLSAADLHAENLVAHGEHPVLIDLEALFHQRLPGIRKDAAALGLTHSVLAQQMLPIVSFVAGFERPIDFSGMGSTAGIPTPFRTTDWVNIGRDDMRLVEQAVETPAGAHCPTLQGRPVDYREFQAEFLAGFEETYRILAAHRDELLAADGLLAALAHDDVRFIARPTQVYGILLEQSLHPAALAAPGVRQTLLQRLETQTQEFSCLGQLLELELADLNQNDVPLFTTTPSSRDVLSAQGRLVRNFFPEPALELVRRRVSQLGEDDLARQYWLIAAAFAVSGRPVATPPVLQEGLDEAIRIGDRLLALAHRDGEDVGWLTVHPRGRGWSIGPAGSDVATGNAGIALFLAYLAQATGAARFRRTAQQATYAIGRRLAWDAPHRLATGQREAAGYCPQALAHLGRLWGDAKLLEQASHWATEFDVVLSRDSSESPLEEAIHYTNRATAANSPPGLPGVDLPGIAHGLAGRGLRLLQGAQVRSAVAT